MKVFAVLFAVVAAASAGLIAPATTILRTPSLDSAVIQSDRLGGNFAYSVAENHAYAAVSPVVSHVTSPVAVSYSAPAVAAPVLGYSGLGYSGLGYAGLGYAGLHAGIASPLVRTASIAAPGISTITV